MVDPKELSRLIGNFPKITHGSIDKQEYMAALSELVSYVNGCGAATEVTEEMVERAAKAMASKDGNSRNWQLYVPDARVAIPAALKGDRS